MDFSVEYRVVSSGVGFLNANFYKKCSFLLLNEPGKSGKNELSEADKLLAAFKKNQEITGVSIATKTNKSGSVST